ncbi:hypothetical protein [Amycolatopsis deserti]|uniref:hypothetical protein n=1 Tax=Amycolatopsis deserti TaxID=185696 RepID=UPI001E40D531|nr:hypothetical protein [Amycolatopsis deserti]
MTVGDSGATESKLRRARLAAGMTQGEVRAKLTQARRRRGKMPPKEASLKRMYTSWETGAVIPTDWRDELCEVFELPPAALGLVETTPPPALDLPSAFEVVRLDPAVISLLDQQTNFYRLQDRLLGAAIIPQTEAHVRNLEQMLRNALPSGHLPTAAVTLAEAAALAGWQALDAGDLRKAWDLHDIAKSAARQGENPAVLAHVTAQQAYVLLDAGRAADAVELVEYASEPGLLGRVPARLRSWLAAAHAEFLAAAGDRSGAMRRLDQAADVLPDGDNDPELPYLMLNGAHLARWRGNCLARLGEDQAIEDLTAALDGLTTLTSRRAEAGLRVDLALALRKRGDLDESRVQARQAAELAGTTGSARQRARIAELLAA